MGDVGTFVVDDKGVEIKVVVTLVNILHALGTTDVVDLLQIVYQIIQQQVGSAYADDVPILTSDWHDKGTEHPAFA